MKHRYIILISMLAILVMVISSCGEEEGGLFYSIEQESKISNGKLADNITIGEVVRNNDYYFIAAGKFLYKSVSTDSDWPAANVSQNPKNYEKYLCHDFALVGNSIYAVFYNIDATDFKIFIADTSNPDEEVSWSAEFSFTKIPDTEHVLKLENKAGRFYVYSVDANNKYNLRSTASATLSEGSEFTDLDLGMSAAGELSIDFDGTDFWIAVGNQVLRSNSTNTSTDNITSNVKAASSKLLGNGFGGILCADTEGDSDDEIYLSSEEGVLLKYNGTDWSVIENRYDETNGLFDSLNGLAHIEISNANEDVNIILAGSEDGYYEMNASKTADDQDFYLPSDLPADIETALTTENQFSSIDLSSSIVQNFYFDDTPDEQTVFALTYNAGLWRNSLKKNDDETYYRFWDIE